MQPKLLTPEQTAKLLNVGRSKLYQLISEGAIETITIGKCRRITPEAIDRFIEQQSRHHGIRHGNNP